MENVISFPKLGITFNVNQAAFHIGSKPIYWYALIILSGFVLALIHTEKSAKKRGINPENVFDIALYGLVIGIICARIYYVIFDFSSFKDNLADIFKIWEGGLAIYGGIIGGALTAFVYCKIKKLNVLKMFDIFAPGLLIGQAIGRYGNFFNAEVYGRETNSLLGMSINGAPPVHPLFFYESCWNLLGLVIILLLRDKKKADGQVFFMYTLWYGIGRLFLEGMRQTQYILYAFANIGISQIVSAVLIAVSVVILVLLGRKKCKNSSAIQ